MLTVTDVDLHYGASQALRRVSLAADKGHVTCVLGRNGVGKTSLLRAIVGQQPVTRGTIAWDDTDITVQSSTQRARRGIAIVPQGREIFPPLTVEENLRTGFAALPRAERFVPEEVFSLFPVLGDMLRRRGGDLSGGQQQQLARADGAARVGFVGDGGTTRLADLAQRSPCRIALPNEGGEPVAVLINTAGGVCGGDKLSMTVSAGDGAAATVVGQAAEKVYRAIDRPAELRTTLTIGDDAALHWAPQETILFDGAQMVRRTTIDLAPDARLLAAETLVFGRTAMGETLGTVSVRDDWQVKIDGRLCWADAFRLDGPAALRAPAGLAGHKALTTLVAAGPDLAAHRDDVRGLLAGDALAGATVVNGLLVVRLLGAAAAVRTQLTAVFEHLRAALLGLAPALPRVWAC